MYRLMKIFRKVIVWVAAAMVVSCAVDNDVHIPVTDRQQEAKFAIPVDATRTMIGEDGKSTYWVAGDKLALWAKNSSGNFVAEGVQFMLHHFSTEYTKAYFSGNIAEQVEDSYTYYMCYPTPKKVEGTNVSYTLPAVQDGTYNGAYDIMVARAVEAGAITSSDQVEFGTTFLHQMHALKITVPEKSSNFANRIYSLEITFPMAVVGDITFDVTAPEAAPTYSNTSNTLVIKSDEGFAVGSDIWVFVLPGVVSGDVSYRVHSLDQRSIVRSYPLERTFERGRVTPIKMAMPEYDKYTVLNFSIGANNLGEDFNTFTLYDNNRNKMGVFERNVENRYTLEYEGEFDASVFSDTNWTFVFDSENAVVENSVNLGTVKPYFQQNIAPVDVPYLLFQDFQSASESQSYGDNDYDKDDDRDQPGVALSGTLAGWNAARFWIKPGAARINSRYQAVSALFTSDHYGRLDTPPLGNGTRGLKSGANVDVVISFDAAYYVLEGSSIEVTSTVLCMTTHTNHKNPIDGIPSGVKSIKIFPPSTVKYDTTVDDFGPVVFSAEAMKAVGSEAFNDVYSHYSTEIKVGANTRLCFYPRMSLNSGAITIGNCETSVYIDNIKVQIKK